MRRIFFYILIGISVVIVFAAIANRAAFFNLLNFKKISLTNEAIQAELENSSLKNEIENLEDQLKFFENISIPTGDKTRQYLAVGVYSSYPFNNARRITIDAGAKDGLVGGMPVLANQGVLLGRVSKTADYYSEVITIFDPEWREPIYIGEREIEGILVGGNEPIIDFINKKAAIGLGDTFKNASNRYPSNLFIGNIRQIVSKADAPFQQASVEFPYKLNEIRNLLVVVNYVYKSL